MRRTLFNRRNGSRSSTPRTSRPSSPLGISGKKSWLKRSIPSSMLRFIHGTRKPWHYISNTRDQIDVLQNEIVILVQTNLVLHRGNHPFGNQTQIEPFQVRQWWRSLDWHALVLRITYCMHILATDAPVIYLSGWTITGKSIKSIFKSSPST